MEVIQKVTWRKQQELKTHKSVDSLQVEIASLLFIDWTPAMNPCAFPCKRASMWLLSNGIEGS